MANLPDFAKSIGPAGLILLGLFGLIAVYYLSPLAGIILATILALYLLGKREAA